MSTTPDPSRIVDLASARVPLWALLLLLVAGGGTAGASLLGSAGGASADAAVLAQRVGACEAAIVRLEASTSATHDNVLLLCQAQGIVCR
jgi:hypothetical protein